MKRATLSHSKIDNQQSSISSPRRPSRRPGNGGGRGMGGFNRLIMNRNKKHIFGNPFPQGLWAFLDIFVASVSSKFRSHTIAPSKSVRSCRAEDAEQCSTRIRQ